MPTARIQGTTLSWSEAGKGEAVLFLHAFPLYAGMWEPQLQALHSRVRAIAPDARGFGGSAGETESMDQIADDAAAILEHCGIKQAVVCGLSMGGYAALSFARRHPSKLRALVLADTKAGADTEEGKAGRETFAKAALQQGSNWVADSLLPKLLRAKPDRRVAEAVRAMIVEATPAAVAAASRALARREDSTASLSRIECPVLIMVGAADVLTPLAEAKKMAAGIAGSQLVELASSGHLSNLEAEPDFNGALRTFLAALPQRVDI